nr:reverse transcriptase domain-containing protein [Tanacetum cinerariifolium]
MISSDSSTSSESSSSEDSVQQWYYNDTESSKGPSKALLQWYEDVMESSPVPMVERPKKLIKCFNQKPKVIVKSLVLIKGCVLGKKIGVRKPESCADKAKERRKPRNTLSQKPRTEEETSRKGWDPGMPEPGPKARNRGAVVPNHRGRKVRKEEWCSKDWRKVCFIGWETRRRMCPHIQEAQNGSHTTVVAGTQKAATKVLALKKHKLLPRNIVTKESILEERKQCQKVKEVQEGTGSQNQRSKSQAWRTTYSNHGVWFDDLPKESIDSYDDLRKAFRESYLQQKKCIKDPIEIHNIKQRNGESTEECVRRYKLECRDVKGAPECMKISGFMHGNTNPELIKRLHDKIPKSMDEMMKKKNASKFCEFYGEVGHTTDECMHLKRQIKEMLKAGKLSFLIKELKQNHEKDQAKITKKAKTSEKDKPLAILMVQPCKFRPKIKNQLIPANTPLVGFSGEIIWPIGQISLLVRVGDEEHSTSAWIKFMVNDKIPSGRWNSHIAEQQDHSARLLNGFRTRKEGWKELCGLLRRHLDVFAWEPADMTGVPRHIAEHRLNVREGCLPVRQKKKGQAPERNKAISEEVKKLAEADIMKEVQYHSWLSNQIMRMCVDFKDLNKACPKDGYSLPEIDWKVESLCGYPYKCFLDAYKGYHQIKMAEEDEEKTAFITSQGILCYLKMPFGLKNAGATYQRLVDKAFQKQIGRNLKVYVDDLVIKSRMEKEVIRDTEETFKTLRKINMKLNPKKCAFGMRESTLLGYKVDADGLRVSPDKVKAVLDLPSPKCLKDVQKLNGKLASLNRFLSKSAEKYLPFFKTLKSAQRRVM